MKGPRRRSSVPRMGPFFAPHPRDGPAVRGTQLLTGWRGHRRPRQQGGRREPSAKAYVCALLILVGLSTAGAVAGHWGRRIHCLRKCRSCEPVLELVQKHRREHGRYPRKLEEVHGFALARQESGLRIGAGELSSDGLDLAGINSHDALIYLEAEHFTCVVPVTKQLPLSFTRLYIYASSSDDPSWKYDKLVWWWFCAKNDRCEWPRQSDREREDGDMDNDQDNDDDEEEGEPLHGMSGRESRFVT